MMSLVNGVLFVGTAGTASAKIIPCMFMVVHGKRRSSTKVSVEYDFNVATRKQCRRDRDQACRDLQG